MRKILTILTVVLILVTMALPAWAQDEVEVEVEGAIESVDGDTFVVGGVTFVLTEDTGIIRGRGQGMPASAEDLEVGVWVDASGVQQEDGTVLARRVRIKAEPALEGEDDEFPEGFEHPVATKLSLYFDISYEDAMALFEEGIGFGIIMKAYRLADANPEAGVTGADLLQMHLDGMGWGEIWHETGVHPGGGPPPWANNDHDGKETGPPSWAGGDDDDEDGAGGPPPWANNDHQGKPPWAGQPGGPPRDSEEGE